MQARSLGREDPLERGIVTHSSVLACRGAWWATVCKAAESRTQPKQSSSHACYELSRWRKLWLIPLLMANTGTRSDFTVEAKFELKGLVTNSTLMVQLQRLTSHSRKHRHRSACS